MNVLKIINKYLSILRPHQWLKNLLLLFPSFFGGKILEPASVSALIPAFLSFSCAASCCYIINDIADREADRQHPDKKDRAIARGDVSLPVAGLLAALLYLMSMLLSASVSERFEGSVIIYTLLTFGYTIYFKHIVIADIFIVSFGFLIRVLAGGEASHVSVTKWLFLTVFIVALFLAAGKRLSELISLEVDAAKQRLSLNRYSLTFLEGVLWSMASCALVTYALYIIENRDPMLYTVPVAAYGLLRYIFIVKGGRGDPTDVLLHDKHILVTGITWVAMTGMILYK